MQRDVTSTEESTFRTFSSDVTVMTIITVSCHFTTSRRRWPETIITVSCHFTTSRRRWPETIITVSCHFTTSRRRWPETIGNDALWKRTNQETIVQEIGGSRASHYKTGTQMEPLGQ